MKTFVLTSDYGMDYSLCGVIQVPYGEAGAVKVRLEVLQREQRVHHEAANVAKNERDLEGHDMERKAERAVEKKKNDYLVWLVDEYGIEYEEINTP